MRDVGVGGVRYTQSKDPMSPYPAFCIKARLKMPVYPSPFPRSSASHSQDAAEVISRTDPSDKRETTSNEKTKERTSGEESFDSLESKTHLGNDFSAMGVKGGRIHAKPIRGSKCIDLNPATWRQATLADRATASRICPHLKVIRRYSWCQRNARRVYQSQHRTESCAKTVPAQNKVI